MPYATSFDGARLWFKLAGTDAEPLLLIAGNACDHGVWDGVVEEFSNHHQVIVFDHRGTGRSEAAFPDQSSTRDFARDAIAVVRAAGFDRTHVYGHSMGGRVAQWLAADCVDNVGALVLGATSAGEKHGVPRPAAATMAMMGNDPASLQRLCYTEDWITRHPGAATAGAPNPCTPAAFLTHLKASSEHDAWDALASITAPTLVIHGGDDGITPAGNAGILAQKIARAHLLIVAGARHVYWAGFPAANEAILRFIRAHGL